MFLTAFLIGSYSYVLFAVGLMGLLYREMVIGLTAVFVCILFFFREKLLEKFRQLFAMKKYMRYVRKEALFFLLFAIILMQALVNLIGALGPELAFDALWYHLTLPKLYLQNHAVYHIPGSLLYYSDMPKLTEMLYVAALGLKDEILAKVIHYSFGILSCVVLYRLSRRYFSPTFALLTVVVFYSNLVVAWESITAYVDLARTFFELLGLFAFLQWWEKGRRTLFMISAAMIGLAISVKLIAVGSLLIFTALIAYKYVLGEKIQGKYLMSSVLIYWCIGLFVPLPWFIFSYVHTGNPLYPLFTSVYQTPISLQLLSPLHFLSEMWHIFTQAADPISPVYILLLPLMLLQLTKLDKRMKIIALYSLFTLLIWYVTPRTGGGRFLMPYLPAFSILAVWTVYKIQSFRRILTLIVIAVAIVSIGYRGFANAKYILVIMGVQTKDDFLARNLNFSFGDFYDTDMFFKTSIKPTDRVLLYGFHNLYYVNFPFVDSSWVKKGDTFNYIAVQEGDLPDRFRSWNMVYENAMTHVKVYSLGGSEWVH